MPNITQHYYSPAAWRAAVLATVAAPGGRLADLCVIDTALADQPPRALATALWPDRVLSADLTPLWLGALVARDPVADAPEALEGYWTTLDPAQPVYPALTPDVPAAHWYERANADLAGITARDHPQPWPLVFDGTWPTGAYPLRASCDATRLTAVTAAAAHAATWGEWQRPTVTGAGVFTIPFGPVRSGVVEAAQYQIATEGEDLLQVMVQPFYKHRGIERRFTGLTLDAALMQAERIAGVHTIAFALAWCQAVEAALAITVPERAAQIRTVLAEMERLHNHLGVIAALCETAALSVGYAQFAMLKERVLRLLARLTASRFGRGMLTVGGVRAGWTTADPQAALREVAQIQQVCERATGLLLRTESFLDRLVGTGRLDPMLAEQFAAVGPVARGSGMARDARALGAYAAYPPLTPQLASDGDAQARLLVRLHEIAVSFDLVRGGLSHLAGGAIAAAVPAPGVAASALGIGWAEAAEGEVLTLAWLTADAAGEWCVSRGHFRPASFVNLALFDRVTNGNNQTDFAFIEHSFGVAIAGCDR